MLLSHVLNLSFAGSGPPRFPSPPYHHLEDLLAAFEAFTQLEPQMVAPNYQDRARQLCVNFLHRIPNSKPAPGRDTSRFQVFSNEDQEVNNTLPDYPPACDLRSPSWDSFPGAKFLEDESASLQHPISWQGPHTNQTQIPNTSPTIPIPDTITMCPEYSTHVSMPLSINPVDLHILDTETFHPSELWASQARNFLGIATNTQLPKSGDPLVENFSTATPNLRMDEPHQRALEIHSTLSLEPAEYLLRDPVEYDLAFADYLGFINAPITPQLPSDFNLQFHGDLDLYDIPYCSDQSSSQECLMDILERGNQMPPAELPFKGKNNGNMVLQ